MAKLVTTFGVQPGSAASLQTPATAIEILPTEAHFALSPFSRPAIRDGKEVSLLLP